MVTVKNLREIVLPLCLAASGVFSETVSSAGDSVWVVFDRYRDTLGMNVRDETETTGVLWFADSDEKGSSESYELRLKKLLRETDRNTYPLRFEAGYRYAAEIDPEDPGFSQDRQRLYAGLRLKLLKDGLAERSREMKVSVLRDNLAVTQSEKEYADLLYEMDSYNNSRNWARIRFEYLQTYVRYLERTAALFRNLYFEGLVSSDDLYKWDEVVVRIRSRLSMLAPSFTGDSSAVLPTPPAGDIAIEELIRNVLSVRYSDAVALHHYEQLKRNGGNVSLDLFLREELSYDNQATHGPAGGVSLSVPVGGVRNSRNEVESLSDSVFALKLKNDSAKVINEISQAYNSYREGLTDLHALSARRNTVSNRLAISRMANLDYDSPSGGPLRIYNLLNDLFEVEYAILESRELLSRKALNLRRVSGLADITPFVRNDQSGSVSGRIRKGERAAYLWSGIFEEHSDEYIIDFATVKEIKTIYLSLSKNLSDEKIQGFIEKGAGKGVAVQLLIGSNELLSPGRMGAVDSLLVRIATLKPSGLHLDIEPHTLPAWKENQAAMTDRYIAVLEKFREGFKGSLGVSIPLFYPPELQAEISKVADEVTVMAYETSGFESLVRRVEDEKVTFGERLSIALRCEDFKTEAEMEKMFEGLYERAGYRRFCIHDISRYIKLTGEK